MSTTTRDVERYERYRRILDAAISADEFTLLQVRETCADEKPAFVTRVVNEMVADGHLAQTDRSSFKWVSSRDEFNGSWWLDTKVYGTQITQTPTGERPRERLLAQGAAALRTAELLAILVRSGRPGESALQAGEKVANRYAGRLEKLADAGRGELKAVSAAIDKTAYCQIMAGIELGRRVANAASGSQQQTRITSSQAAVAFCRGNFARLATEASQEEFHIVCLNTKNGVIATHQITVGTLDASLVHPREVFRPAIKDAAASILLVHNHPSGDPTPSREDLQVTTKLEGGGEQLGIKVLDHIILGRDQAVSIQEYRATSHS